MSINQASLVILATLSLSFTCIVSDQVDLIAAACSNATDKCFCNQMLSTNCSTSRFDLKLMGQCITAEAINATTHAKLVFLSLKNFPVANCRKSFDEALGNLKTCARAFVSQKGKPLNISELKAKSDAAMAELNTCKVDLDGGDIEPEKQNGDAIDTLKDTIDILKDVIAYAKQVIGVLLGIVNAIKT